MTLNPWKTGYPLSFLHGRRPNKQTNEQSTWNTTCLATLEQSYLPQNRNIKATTRGEGFGAVGRGRCRQELLPRHRKWWQGAINYNWELLRLPHVLHLTIDISSTDGICCCPLCPGLHGVYVKQRVTKGPEIDSVKVKFIHINPNWHEGGYFYLVILFESDFASWIVIKNFQTFSEVEIDIN